MRTLDVTETNDVTGGFFFGSLFNCFRPVCPPAAPAPQPCAPAPQPQNCAPAPRRYRGRC